MNPKSEPITVWLQRFKSGDSEAESVLLDMVYRELHRLAEICMSRERKDHTLQATALVHEAYMRMVDHDNRDFQNRTHFLAAASQVMRRILIDYARAHQAAKRGGQKVRVELQEDAGQAFQKPEEVLALDQALKRLADWDERQSRIVEMRFFGGMTEEEIADNLGISVRTVKREWSMARAWLYGEIAKNAGAGSAEG